MLGFYDYTTVLTYLSLLSACTGIVLSLAGQGHPYMACFCLLSSGTASTSRPSRGFP